MEHSLGYYLNLCAPNYNYSITNKHFIFEYCLLGLSRWHIWCQKWDLRQSHHCRTDVSWSCVWAFCAHCIPEWYLLWPWVLSGTNLPPFVWGSHLSLGSEDSCPGMTVWLCWLMTIAAGGLPLSRSFPGWWILYLLFALPLEGFPRLISTLPVCAFFHIIGLPFPKSLLEIPTSGILASFMFKNYGPFFCKVLS